MLDMLDSDPSNVSLVQECVRTALDEGRTDGAEAAIAKARQHGVPESVLAYLGAQLDVRQAKWPEAIATLTQLAGQTSLATADRAEVLFMLGFALFQGGSFTAAADVLTRCLQIPEARPDALVWLLRSLHQSGEPTRACDAWTAAPRDRRSAWAAGVASLAFFDTNNHAEAKALADACLHERSDCIEALVVKAAEDLLEDSVGSAVSLLERALQLNGGDGRIWSTFATARLRGGDVDGAIDAYQRATQTMTEHIGTWSGKAWAHIIKRDFGAARSSLQRAMEIDDRFGETHGSFAVVNALEGRREEAQTYLVTARRLDPAGFAWRYAEALLSGEVRDAQALQQLAQRLLASRGFVQFRNPGATLH